MTRSTRTALILTALLALTAAVFLEVRHFDFVSWDDPFYVTENARVRGGLSWTGLRWALTTGEGFYWHPLTWVTHMVDVEVHGLRAGGHHVTNLLIHLTATAFLFLGLRRLSRATWRSAMVAALFAVHPLHVESVAWVAERKDVLAGLFWMATLWAHARYADRPGPARYAAVAGCLALGLMSKPMVVTLPVVLLVLDVWPLGRLGAPLAPTSRTTAPGVVPGSRGVWLLVREKLPLLALGLASAVVTIANQAAAGALRDVASFPLGLRVENAVVSIAGYLRLTVWPAGLAAFYPYPDAIPLAAVAASALLLLALTGAAAWQWRQRPYLAAGWAWFIISLLPVSGLVQVGEQAMADRFTYIPLVGVFIAVVWGVGDLVERRPPWRRALVALCAGVLGVLAVAAHAQVATWQDSRALWERAARVTTRNHRAHANLALLAEESGRRDEAIAEWQQVVELLPASADTRNRLGMLLYDAHRPAEAAAQFAETTRLRPGDASAWNKLGMARQAEGRVDEGILALSEAVRLEPSSGEYASNLGALLDRAGRAGEALSAFEAAVRARPDHAGSRMNLGAVLGRLGRPADAARELAEAVRLDPGLAMARFNLAVALAQLGRLDEAAREGLEAVRIEPGRADWHYNVSVWLYRLGDRVRAAEHLDAAARLDPRFGAVTAR